MSVADPIRRAGLHARLRAATDPAHRALEAGLDWQARVATRAGYRDLLARLHGFHATWEDAIGAQFADEAFLGPRRRLASLAADLDYLGLGPAAVVALPRSDAVVLDGPAAATGALYVLEGSTLGGQLIGRHIAGLHGFGERGLTYYRAHGPRTGAMWAAFRARLETFADDPGEEAVLTAAAVVTFAAMRDWLCTPHDAPVAGG